MEKTNFQTMICTEKEYLIIKEFFEQFGVQTRITSFNANETEFQVRNPWKDNAILQDCTKVIECSKADMKINW
jgi:hypothetical protein